MNTWRHWRCEWDEDHYATVFFEAADRSVNVLSREALDELSEVTQQLQAEAPSGVILGTRPGRAFAVGADVHEIARLQSRRDALELLQHGQEVFEQWQSLECPTVAAIRGYCLGGGMELALACDYRVAERNPDSRLGLPEVRLGIHPGYGGTVRLPEVIGDLAALKLIVTGKTIGPSAAAAMNLVDATVASRHLHRAARKFLKEQPTPRRAQRWKRIPHLTPLRNPVAYFYRRRITAKVPRRHYPAPHSFLEHWQCMSADPTAALRAEARSVAALFEAPQTRQLVRIFGLREALRQQFADTPGPESAKITHVHVVGAGVMGGDIAAWCAAKGLRVTLQDTEMRSLANAVRRAHKSLGPDASRSLDLLHPDPEGVGVQSADVVLEAISEDQDAKQALHRILEAQMRPEALLATNTSSLPLAPLASTLEDPTRLVGVHFFNPVRRIPLVEVIHHNAEQEAWLQRAGSFVQRIDRLPVSVRSVPGFLVNRILMPYLLEAVYLLEEGVSATTIDQAAVEFGMPQGPLELADHIGLDICAGTGAVLAEAYQMKLPDTLHKHVEAGHLGVKTGRGFYVWPKRKRRHVFSKKPPPDCVDRLILSMVRAAVHCLHEKVMDQADLIDASMIFATGFAPHLGGPLQMVRTAGAVNMHKRLEQLTQHYGHRFAPGEGWDTEQLRETP